MRGKAPASAGSDESTRDRCALGVPDSVPLFSHPRSGYLPREALPVASRAPGLARARGALLKPIKKKREKLEGKRERTPTAYRMGEATKTSTLARTHARWVCAAAVVLWLAGTSDAMTAVAADGLMASRAVRGALDGACFVAFVAASLRIAMQRVGCGWRVPTGSIAAAAAAGALVPDSMQATPWSLALFCGCALVGAL
nr:hypothetical protein [Pandoravirus massiliensis]